MAQLPLCRPHHFLPDAPLFGRLFHQVKPLSPSDQRCLEAAQGWLMLGNFIEADSELDNITPLFRVHPQVLAVRWQVYAKAERWDGAFEIARTLVEQLPDDSFGWIHQAYALRRMDGGGVKAAWDALLPAADKFPTEPTVAFNLACYACQLGNLTEARDWLSKAIELGDKDDTKTRALDDPDLEPLWSSIGKL
jgi:tetratricopeptide (TPR) repeat protein